MKRAPDSELRAKNEDERGSVARERGVCFMLGPAALTLTFSPSLDHGRDLVLTELQSIIFGKLKNTKK